MSVGDSLQPVVVKESSPVQGGPAIPVRGYTSVARNVKGGPALPVYVVSDAQLDSGQYQRAGGKPMPVILVSDLGGVHIVEEGQYPIPVYAVNDWPTAPYTQQVLNLLSDGLLAYWPMNETSGSTVDNAEGTAARDGTFNGVTLDSSTFPNAGDPVGLWPGANSAMNAYSVSLSSAFDGQSFTLGGWFRVFNAGVWSDGATRRFAHFNGSTAGDDIILQKQTTGGSILIQYVAGGTAKNKFISTSTADWFHLVITVSLANDRFRAYFNGVQDGADITGLGTWTNSGLVSAESAVGASTGSGGTFPFNGYCYGFGIWNRELTAAEIGDWYALAT